MGCDSWFSGTDTCLWFGAHESPVEDSVLASGFSNIVANSYTIFKILNQSILSKIYLIRSCDNSIVCCYAYTINAKWA